MQRFLSAAALPTQLFLSAALTFYFGNHQEITFSLSDILPLLVVVFLIMTMIIYILLRTVKRFQYVHTLVLGLVVGLALCVWVQSQLLVWNFGPLDGRGIPWESWKNLGYFELLAWLTITLSVLLAYSKRVRLVNSLPTLLIALAAVSAFTSYISRTSRPLHPIVTEDAFRFHPENNTIVIVLDTLQSDYFEQIMKDHPEELEFLDGFTFYRNTISSYPTTAPNLPAVLTGKTYRNEIPFSEFIKESYTDSSNIIHQFENRGYATAITSISPQVIPGAAGLSSLLNQGTRFKISSLAQFIDYGIFRSSPIFLKELVYNNGNWLITFHTKGNYPPGEHGADIRFLDILDEKASIDTSSKINGSFNFYHFYGAHMPLRINEKLEYDAHLVGAEGYSKQVRGAMQLAKRVISKLRDLGVYDSAEIIIMADHGTMVYPPLNIDLNINEKFNVEVPDTKRSTALALLMHKAPKSETDGIHINDAPIYHKDLRCMLTSLSNENEIYCADYNSALRGQPRERTYYYYDWKHEYWGRSYMPPITEYIIDGHAYQPNSWQLGQYRYTAGRKEEAPRPAKISLNQTVSFRAGGLSAELVKFGWSMQEETHRWSDGPQAGLVLVLEDPPTIDVNLQFDLIPYRDETISRQEVKVSINGEYLATWNIQEMGRYTVSVPAQLIRNNRLEVLFDISSPSSKCGESELRSCRQLGVAVTQLTVTESERPQ